MKITKFNDIPRFIRNGSYEVDFSPDRLIKRIDEMVAEEWLDLDPEFQRGHVWNDAQRTSFIEFFLKGGITGKVIYLNNPSWHNPAKTDYNDFVIVDGKQRLEAWRKFINNEVKAFGSYFKDYTDSMRLASTMRLNINNLQTKAEVLQWYIDFNSGGVVHSDEEIARVKKLLAKEKRKK